MKLINFHIDQTWGQDYYIQALFTKQWALFQGSVSWANYAEWPFLQIQFGSGSLLNIVFNVFKFGISASIFDRTWKLH